MHRQIGEDSQRVLVLFQGGSFDLKRSLEREVSVSHRDIRAQLPGVCTSSFGDEVPALGFLKAFSPEVLQGFARWGGRCHGQKNYIFRRIPM